ncbi:MAG: hypothetical protein ACREAA_10230 [Candidatus Polarisedimenticolia bacterium]
MDELLRDQVIVVPGRPAGWDKEELVGEQEFQHLRSGRLRVKGGSALTALKSRFSRLDSVHIKATARVVKFLGAEQEGANQEHVAGLGQFEYWASGDKYRVNSSSDPALGLEGDSQTAWNSKEFQFFRPSDSVLSIQRTDPGMVSAALPNPFFLETMFLTRDSDSCPTCLTSPGDLRNARRWSRVLDRAHSEETAQRAGETVLVPGQVLHGLPLVYRLAFQGGGAGTKLESIDRLTRGRVLSTTRFSDYRPADQGGGEFARHIEEHVYDDAGNVLAHLGWTIDVVEINQVIPDEIFTIDRESAPAIWDSETGRFTKHWRFEE